MRRLKDNSNKLKSHSRRSYRTSKSQVGRKRVAQASFQNYLRLNNHRIETSLMTRRFSMMQRQINLRSNRLKPHLIVFLKNCNCQKSKRKPVINRKGIYNRGSNAKARLRRSHLLLKSRSSHQDRKSCRRSSNKPTLPIAKMIKPIRQQEATLKQIKVKTCRFIARHFKSSSA